MKTLTVLFSLFLACLAKNNECSSNDPSYTLANCLASVKSGLVALKVPYLPADPTLTKRLDIKYTAEPIKFTSCCNTYDYKERTYLINPLDFGVGNTVYLSPVEQRSTPAVTVDPGDPAKTAKKYALLMVDLTVPLPDVGTKDKPFLHWLVVNFDLSSAMTSVTGFEYMGPGPSDQEPHTYAFFLYEQSAAIDTATLNAAQYGGCPKNIAQLGSRCLFDAAKFTTDQSLTLKGASWLQTLNDAYTNYTYIKAGQGTESELCKWVQGYSDPCGAANLGVSILALVAVCLFQFMF